MLSSNMRAASGATVRAPAERMDPALAKRVGSSLVLVAAAMLALWLGRWVFAAVVVAGVLVMAHEWSRLATDLDERARWLMLVLSGAAPAIAAVVTARADAGNGLLLLVLALPLAGACMALATSRGSSRAATGVLYLGLPAVALVWLRDRPDGAAVVLWLLLVVWTTDVAAYFVGRAVGGAKLAPSISPGKTWAGLIGGMAGAALMGAVASGLGVANAWLGAAMALVLAVVAQIGDLFESFMKRRAGVKDSGTLIPGHGGALDRLDGLLFAAPAYAALIAIGLGIAG